MASSTTTPTAVAPVITGGAQADSTRVFGHGAPNIPQGQLEIHRASDNALLGTGGTDAAGNFVNGGSGIPVDPPLATGDRVFAVDVQHGVPGSQVTVIGPGQVPDLNPWGASFLGLSLLVVMAARLRRVAR